MPVTEPIRKLKAEVFQKFPTTHTGGDFVVKKIRGTNTWSQHSWGNALDIMVPNLATGDKVQTWVLLNRGRLGLGTVLWRVKDHFDHLHVEGLPKQRGTPPAASGGTRQPEVGLIDRVEGNINEWIGGIPVVGDIAGVVGGAEDAIDTAKEVAGLVFSAETWIRVGLFVGGGILIGGGLWIFASQLGMDPVKQAISKIPAGKVAGRVASVVS